MLIAGFWPRPQELSLIPWVQSPYVTQVSHSSNVSSNLATANGLTILTVCCGPSQAWRPFSVGGDPIMNSPAGTTIISGQSLAHSRKASPALSARSASALKTYGFTFAALQGRTVVYQFTCSFRYA